MSLHIDKHSYTNQMFKVEALENGGWSMDRKRKWVERIEIISWKITKSPSQSWNVVIEYTH